MTRLLIRVWGEPSRAVIVADVRQADALWSAWCLRRYAKGLPLGGAVIDRVVPCACGGWARWILGRCDACVARPQLQEAL